MNESFLHYLWKFRLYNSTGLTTTDGEKLEVLKPGQHNTDAGPDFFNAQVRIGKTRWAGNVEVHLKSSDWKKHRHSWDNAYGNVILHVVYEHDKEIFEQEGKSIHTLELKKHFNHKLLDNYALLQESGRRIPCELYINEVSRITVASWLERLLVERLEARTSGIYEELALNHHNWEETFYMYLARNFGFKTNSLPFEMLAKALPLTVLAKHKDRLFQIEALLFGTAGLLEKDFADEYPQQLKKEYAFLRKKYGLNTLDGSLWKFLRLRPQNFPTIRLAQFSRLIYSSSKLFSRLMEADDASRMISFFRLPVSDYWKEHYRFGKKSPASDKVMGEDSVNLILLNTVAPFLFAYGKYRGSEAHEDKAMELLEKIPAENNSVIAYWMELGMKARNAADTQALLQLKNGYCSEKKCLSCAIGNKIISRIP